MAAPGREAKAADLAWGSPERAQAADEGLAVGDVDSADHEKAKALVQWAKWLKWATYDHRASGTSGLDTAHQPDSDHLDVYFWIDYCSALQNTREAPAQIVPYMAALPAYVAVCAIVAAYWTDGLRSRVVPGRRDGATLSSPPATSSSSCPAAGVHARRKGFGGGRITVPNPGDRATAQLTNEADRPVVAALTETARRSQAFTCGRTCARNCETDCSALGNCMWRSALRERVHVRPEGAASAT